MQNSPVVLQQVPGHRRRSSSLDALGTLTPPSPELTPSSLQRPSQFGEILVTLYNDFPQPSFRAESPPEPVPTSQSTDTVDTFGLKKRTDSIWETQSIQETDTIVTPVSPSVSFMGLFPARVPLAASASDSCMMSHVDTAQTHSMSSSASASVNSQPLYSGQTAPQIFIDSVPPRQPLKRLDHYRRGPTIPSVSSLGSLCAASTANLVSSISMESGLNLPQSAYCSSRHSKYSRIPMDFAWLKQRTIQLWIDQESFRAIQVDLGLSRLLPGSASVSEWSSSLTNRSKLTEYTAEFKPIKSDNFVFHYGALDAPPILRRVAINGDETRDYISRQASLIIKTNGVYTISGVEESKKKCTDQMSFIHWRLEYLVDDRISETTGKAIQGEKTITPLSFFCNPDLFNYCQGQKVNLLQVMKKNFTPKLSAERMLPPTVLRNLDRNRQTMTAHSSLSMSQFPKSASCGQVGVPTSPQQQINHVNVKNINIRRPSQHQRPRSKLASAQSRHHITSSIGSGPSEENDENSLCPSVGVGLGISRARSSGRAASVDLLTSGPHRHRTRTRHGTPVSVSSPTTVDREDSSVSAPPSQPHALHRHILPKAELLRLFDEHLARRNSVESSYRSFEG